MTSTHTMMVELRDCRSGDDQRSPDADGPDARCSGRYDQDVKQALETTAEIIPEITSPDNKQLYLLLAAITSVGQSLASTGVTPALPQCTIFRTGEIGEQGSMYSEKRGVSEKRTVNPTTGKVFGPKPARSSQASTFSAHDQQTWRGWHPRVGD